MTGRQGGRFAFHERRYFSQGEPTKLVRDGLVEAYDPPPVTGAPAAGEAQAEERLGVTELNASSQRDGMVAPQDEVVGQRSYDVFFGVLTPDAPATPVKRRVRGPLLAAAVLAVALATALGVLLTGTGDPGPDNGPGAGMAPAAFVTSATRATLARRTADLDFRGSIQVSGVTIPLQGTGQVNLSARTLSASFDAAADGHSVVVRELVVGGRLYEAESLDGTSILASVAPGKTWLEYPSSLLAASGTAGTVDPIDQLRTLSERGNSVKRLGVSILNGVTVSEFEVTPSRQTFAEGIAKAVAAAALPAGLARKLDKQITQMALGEKLDVWIDLSHLVRQLSVNVSISGLELR
jgi:hypothetical protein